MSQHNLPAESPVCGGRWWREGELLVLVALALAIYGTRLTDVTIRGEESRWARAAYEMVTTGDWAVPRQQGQMHADRPPLAIWAIALSGLAWGSLGAISTRIPSVLATLLTGLAIYAYGRTFLSRLGALAAAAMFLTMGQVMQLGRLAENDPLFALFVSSSLLAWHAGYQRGWRPVCTWTAGYSLAALAVLTKGPQGIAYFCGPVWVYLLLVQRDWRFLLSGWHVAGLAALAAIYAAWLIPFYRATDWQSVAEISWATSAMRYAGHSPLWKHLLTYPLEILACTLPWSPLLARFAWPSFWRSLDTLRPSVVFLATCLAVTFPSVWFATEAHTRYYLSMFPCLALLIGVVVERCAESAAASSLGWAWRLYLGALGVIAVGAGVVVIAGRLLAGAVPAEYATPTVLAVAYLLTALVTAELLFWCARPQSPWTARAPVMTLACFVGLTYTGVAITSQARTSQDFASVVAQFKRQLPPGERMVSLGRLDHLFTFYFGDSIDVVPWPTGVKGPADGEFFCFTPTPDTPEDLPFTWQQVAVMSCSRSSKLDPLRLVIVGRRLDAPIGEAATLSTKTRRY